MIYCTYKIYCIPYKYKLGESNLYLSDKYSYVLHIHLNLINLYRIVNYIIRTEEFASCSYYISYYYISFTYLKFIINDVKSICNLKPRISLLHFAFQSTLSLIYLDIYIYISIYSIFINVEQMCHRRGFNGYEYFV